jgi:hypothetical protein
MSKTFISKNDASRYTLGVVYEPNVIDSQGDFAEADAIEKAAWKFMKVLQDKSKLTEGCVKAFKGLVEGVKKGEGNIDITDLLEAIQKADATGLGVQHSVWGAELGDIVESYIAPCDMIIGEQSITKGTWMMGTVWNDENWAKVQKGEMTGYSMGGTGTRIDIPE